MQRNDLRPSDPDKGRKASIFVRLLRRGRAGVRFGLRRLHDMRAALAFAGLLAGVGMAMFSPLLLDDLAFLPSYLLRPSPDAIVITEPIVVSEQPRMTVQSGTLSVPPSLSGQARTGEALAALVKGGSARLALKGPVIHLDLSPQAFDDRSGESGWPLPALQLPLTANSPLMTALEDASFETLSVRDATILLHSEGRTDELTEVSADITVKRKTAVRLKGSFRYAGELLTVDATLGARIGRGASARMPLRAQVAGLLFSATIEGRVELGQGLTLAAPIADVSIPNLRSMARWLGHVWPSGPGLRNFAARGSATWTGQSIAFQKGTFELDGNSGNGALSLTMGASKPSIAGTVAFGDADATVYLGPADGRGGAAAETDRAAGKSLISQFKSARDLSLPLLGAVDADLRFSAETLTAGPLKGGRAAASLALRDGHLVFNLADMELANGGTIDGEIGIEGLLATPSYSVQGRMQGGEMSDAASMIAGFPMLRGRGSLHFDFRAGGRAGMDVLSRLNGTIQLDMPSGGVAMCSLRELTASAASESVEACRSSTSLAAFKSAATVTNGVIAFDQIDIASGSNRMRLDGTLDLVSSAIHLNVSATAPQSSVAVVGEQPPDLAPARDILAIRGRADDVKITARGK